MNDTDKFLCLKKKEAFTVYLICMGWSNAKISEVLKEDKKTTESRITRIYKKLEISGEGEEKRLTLQRRFVSIVRKHIRSVDDIIFWVPKKPSKVKANLDKIIDDDNPLDEKEEDENFVPILPSSSSQRLPSGEYPFDKKGKETETDNVWKFILLALLLLVGGYIVITRLLPPVIPLIPGIQTPENTPTSTQSPTLVSTVEDTATIEPTPTITPKPTITHTPTATPVILFETHFEDSVVPGSDEWNVLTPNVQYSIENGIFTPAENYLVTIGDDSWKNYRINLAYSGLNRLSCFYGAEVVGIRAKSQTDHLFFYLCDNQADFRHRDGSKFPNGVKDTGGADVFEVEVSEDHVKYLGKDITISENDNGFVFLNLRAGVGVRKIKIAQLP